MKVAVIQHDICWEDAAATFDRLREPIHQAAAAGARLAVLSEMFSTGFSMASEVIAEPPGGPSEMFLKSQAAENGLWLLGSVAQYLKDSDDARPGNVAILAGPDGQLHRYVKIHPFSYGGEPEHYQAGRDFLTVTVEDLKVSVFICYDLRFADEFWQLADDTDVYVVPANWPQARRAHWRALLQARAIENLAYVVGCNRVGSGGNLNYVGDSTIIDPTGRRLAEAGDVETVLIAEVNPEVVQSTRKRYGFLVDRR